MKFTLTILVIAFALVTHGQINETHVAKIHPDFKRVILGKYYVAIDNTNDQAYYEKVKSLVNFEDKDSSYKATKLMSALCLYDDVKYSTEFFEPLLDRIQRSNEAYYDKILKGQWRFSHDFWTGLTSEPTTTTANDTGRTIVFRNGYAKFYLFDTLQRATQYKIIPQSTGLKIPRVNNFKILILDKNEYWTFVIDSNRESLRDSVSLTVILGPNCNCSCGSDIYFKQKKSV